MATSKEISRKLKAKQVVIISYLNDKQRTIELYYQGIAKDSDLEQVRAYQLKGYSESGNPTAWKLFNIEDIKLIKDSKLDFPNPLRSDYEEKDSYFIGGKLVAKVDRISKAGSGA